MGKGDRPEHIAPPEIFYNEDEARKYTSNSRMIQIQVRWALLCFGSRRGSSRQELVRRTCAQAASVMRTGPLPKSSV